MEVVVAPHFDDAALSTAHVLVAGRADVTVVTVCAGAPPPGERSGWDEFCGFASGNEAGRLRAEEDQRANAVTGARWVHLTVCDSPYRHGYPAGDVAADLAAALPAGGAVWVPAGIGSHPDHLATRDVVFGLVAAASGRLHVYAECPYAFAFGWHAADEERDEDHRWAEPLRSVERHLGPLRRHDVRLDDGAMALKLAMVGSHESQVRGLLPEVPELVDADGPLRAEVFWTALGT